MPGFPRQPDDAEIIADLFRQLREERNKSVERSSSWTFHFPGQVNAGMYSLRHHVVEPCALSGVIARQADGASTPIVATVYAHDDGSFAQDVSVPGGTPAGKLVLWEQSWAPQLAPGDPVWINVKTADVLSHDLAITVVFGGEAGSGGSGGGGGGFT